MSKPDNTLEPDKPAHPPALAADLEKGSQPPSAAMATAGFGVPAILQRWRREDMIRRGSVILRGLGLVFSLLSFIIMASNNHGDWRQFGKYEEYRYVLGIAILSTLYTGVQTLINVQQLSTGKELLPFQNQRTLGLFDFLGDQIMAYLLLSSASSAIPITNRMREGADNIFTDSSASAISMSLLAFAVLACSSVISGFKLSTHSYI